MSEKMLPEILLLLKAAHEFLYLSHYFITIISVSLKQLNSHFVFFKNCALIFS